MQRPHQRQLLIPLAEFRPFGLPLLPQPRAGGRFPKENDAAVQEHLVAADVLQGEIALLDVDFPPGQRLVIQFADWVFLLGNGDVKVLQHQETGRDVAQELGIRVDVQRPIVGAVVVQERFHPPAAELEILAFIRVEGTLPLPLDKLTAARRAVTDHRDRDVEAQPAQGGGALFDAARGFRAKRHVNHADGLALDMGQRLTRLGVIAQLRQRFFIEIRANRLCRRLGCVAAHRVGRRHCLGPFGLLGGRIRQSLFDRIQDFPGIVTLHAHIGMFPKSQPVPDVSPVDGRIQHHHRLVQAGELVQRAAGVVDVHIRPR